MSLLSPSLSKKPRLKSKVENEMVKSVEKFCDNLPDSAKRKFESFLVENNWHQEENETLETSSVFSPERRRKVDTKLINKDDKKKGD